ncbi:MAG: hypothetical protein F6K19_43590 [Cyanothece sp. SIO1E1]|nr:hypothetical protein [Cyanothece sp. SIO1E1]
MLSWSTLGLATPSVITIKIYASRIGVSTRHIGACEGNINFDLADMIDLGINTYRIYGGMSRWELDDDDGVYGLPTIAQIKENPDLIPWKQWDAVMTSPETGTDYAFAGNNPEALWQGSARTIFKTLKQGHIRPVLTIRNTDPSWHPDWALQLNPSRTAADWNEWWEHVFATVYWLNVRNNYQVNDFEIHNEPDNREQGWGGNQEDYFELVRVASDAIAHVYSTYLPGRSFHIHAPNTIGGSHWPGDTLANIPADFDNVNVHTYDLDISAYVQQVRNWMHSSNHGRSPLWLGEWGTYTGGYNDLTFSLNLIKNMMRMSQPGDTYVDGSHIFSLYDWGRTGEFEGLVNAKGDRRLSYYAFRMGIRALQGGRDVLLTTSSSPDLMAIATQDDQGKISLLIVNSNSVEHSVKASIPTLKTQRKATIWEFSETILDAIIAETHIKAGSISFQVPAHSSRLVVIN